MFTSSEASRIWKAAFVTCLKVLSWHSPGEAGNLKETLEKTADNWA
jgi:hypothetical protein